DHADAVHLGDHLGAERREPAVRRLAAAAAEPVVPVVGELGHALTEPVVPLDVGRLDEVIGGLEAEEKPDAALGARSMAATEPTRTKYSGCAASMWFHRASQRRTAAGASGSLGSTAG